MSVDKKTKEYLIQRLRKSWLEHKSHYATYKLAPQKKIRNSETGRMITVYQCSDCGKYYDRGDLEVDHIEEVGEFKDWNAFVERLFCPQDNLQLLCVRCHKRKTHSVGNLLACDLELL